MRKTQIPAKLFLLAVGLFLFVPLIATGIYAFSSSWTGLLPKGMTLKFFQDIFSDPRLLPSLGRSVIIGVIPIFITVLIVVLALYTCIVYAPGLERVVQTLCMAPYTIQGVILSVSVLSVYVSSPTFLSNRIVMLTGIYCVCCLPHIYQGTRNSMNTINVNKLLEAAEILGSSKIYAFLKVVFPSLLQGIIISAMICMTMIFGDFVIIKLIAGNQWTTGMMLLANARSQAGQVTSAMVLVLFLTTLLISFAVYLLKNMKAAASAIRKH